MTVLHSRIVLSDLKQFRHNLWLAKIVNLMTDNVLRITPLVPIRSQSYYWLKYSWNSQKIAFWPLVLQYFFEKYKKIRLNDQLCKIEIIMVNTHNVPRYPKTNNQTDRYQEYWQLICCWKLKQIIFGRIIIYGWQKSI